MIAMVGVVVLALSTIGVICGVIYVCAVRHAKKEVNAAPRVPMHICKIHGAYPASSTITISVPQEGTNDLPVEMCIFCYNEKMKTAEAILKK